MFGVVVLLAFAVFINYVDRGNLATAASLIKSEFHLSPSQLGVLLSAFFWTYTPCQLLSGWLAERINAYRTLALGLAIWSIATLLSAFAAGFFSLIVLRLLLGLGESAAFPCSAKLLAQGLPGHKLGMANGLIMMGMAFGPSFGTFTGGLLMAHEGWRATFIVFGALSLMWLWPWLATTRDVSLAAQLLPRPQTPSFRTILRRREAWGASLGHFSANYCYYFVLSWLPLYLVKEHGLTMAATAALAGFIYLVHGTSSLATGWICDRLMRAGASANSVRKPCMVASHVGMTLAMLGVAVGSANIAIACLFLAALSFGLNSPNLFASGQTLAGPGAAGKWIGVQNCVGNMAGIVAPVVTGFVVERTGAFYWAFVIAALFAMAGIVFWGILIRRIAPLNWELDTP